MANKIIHIITSLGIGGAEQMLKRLLCSDPNLKKQIVVVSLSGPGVVGEQLESLGYQVHTLDFRQGLSLASNFWALVKLIKTYKPALVQTWMYHADFFGGLAAKMAGCSNIIWGIRNTFVPINNKKTYYLMRFSALLSYWLPKKIICVAEAAKNSHVAYGYQRKKIQVIPNGFDFALFDPHSIDKHTIRQECGLTHFDLIIGCVGRFHLDKGQDIFIKAASLIKQSHSKHLTFMLVGRGCDEHNELLMQQIQSLGLRANFILLGERQDVAECLAAMDIFCMPSRSEGFPNGLGEAMAMGLPCVATQVGDAKILAGDCALLVPAEDPEGLAQGLTQLICMPKVARQTLGEKAAHRLREYFCINKARERFYEVYRDIAELSF